MPHKIPHGWGRRQSISIASACRPVIKHSGHAVVVHPCRTCMHTSAMSLVKPDAPTNPNVVEAHVCEESVCLLVRRPGGLRAGVRAQCPASPVNTTASACRTYIAVGASSRVRPPRSRMAVQPRLRLTIGCSRGRVWRLVPAADPPTHAPQSLDLRCSDCQITLNCLLPWSGMYLPKQTSGPAVLVELLQLS